MLVCIRLLRRAFNCVANRLFIICTNRPARPRTPPVAAWHPPFLLEYPFYKLLSTRPHLTMQHCGRISWFPDLMARQTYSSCASTYPCLEYSGPSIFQLHSAIPSTCLMSWIHSNINVVVCSKSFLFTLSLHIFFKHSFSVVIRSISKIPTKFCVHVNRCGTSRFLFLGGASISGHRHADCIARAQHIWSSSVINSGKCNAL